MYGNNDKYLGLKKAIAFVASLGLWGVSIYFSYKGFEFDSTTVLWFGIVMALVVTVVELVFNTKISKLNPTLLVVGIVSYIYGIYTNITGFYILQHGTLTGFFTDMNWLIPIFSGVIAEVLPEALFAWSIGAFNEGDLIGNIGEMFTNSGNSPKTVVQDSVKHYGDNRNSEPRREEHHKPSPAMMQNLPHSKPDTQRSPFINTQNRQDTRRDKPAPREEPLENGGFTAVH
jgi:hypothetical protein